MSLLDEIVSFDESTLSVCASFSAHAPWLDSTAAIEYMAQAAACLAGMSDRCRDSSAPSRPGLLLGSRRIDLSMPGFVKGGRYFVRATCAFSDSDAAAFECSISRTLDGASLATAILNAYRPQDFGAFLKANM